MPILDRGEILLILVLKSGQSLRKTLLFFPKKILFVAGCFRVQMVFFLEGNEGSMGLIDLLLMLSLRFRRFLHVRLQSRRYALL